MIKKNEANEYRCTNCGGECQEQFNYCPYCGTKKDKKTLKDYQVPSELAEKIVSDMKNDNYSLYPFTEAGVKQWVESWLRKSGLLAENESLDEWLGK